MGKSRGHQEGNWEVPPGLHPRGTWERVATTGAGRAILGQSLLQGPQALQDLLGLDQLLLQPLAGALTGGPLQEALHLLHHSPVAWGIVEKPHGTVPTGGQEATGDVKSQVGNALPVDRLEALLLLPTPRVEEMNTGASGQGQDMGVRGERQAARHGACLFKAACP